MEYAQFQSAEQMAEIDRRLKKLEKGKRKLYSWEEVRQSISKRELQYLPFSAHTKTIKNS